MNTDTFFAMIVVLGLTVIKKSNCDNAKDRRKGPRFVVEPPVRVLFSNTAGAELRCGASGHPSPKIYWQTREGTPVSDVSGLRYQRIHKDVGTLVFPPFTRPEYRQEVHDVVYQCVASNEFGSIISREVHVRGAVKQSFSPQVYDEFVTRGNTAVFRCHLPPYAREHVHVDAWIRSDGYVIKTFLEEQNRGKPYTTLISGELLIRDVREKDSEWSYRCQTRHKLTGEMVTSENSGKVVITEPHVSTLPRITFSRSQVRAEEGSMAQLPCVAQGNPPPSYKWMKDVSGLLRPVETNGRIWLSQGILTIQRVTKSDSGQYQCIARNSIGERRLQTLLIVTAALSVSLMPERLELAVGQEATFSCNVSGYPLHQIFWMKDRRHVLATDTRVRLLSTDVLHISSVRREDRGMYQCFAQNDKDSSQGTAELDIADAPPSLVSVAPDITVHPGERVSMKCIAMGNPAPIITWLLDGETAPKSARVTSDSYSTVPSGHIVSYLNISSTRTDDSGEYTCQSTNDVGTASHSSRLNIFGPPFVRNMPNRTAVSGQQLTLKCPYGGHPIEKVFWFKGDDMLPLEPRQKVTPSGALIVQFIQRNPDQGQYRCEVHSSDGQSASGSTYVSVVVAPEINSMLLPEAITMDEGNRAKLVCVVILGDTPLRFQWMKNDQPFLAHGDATVHTFEDSSIITIKRVTANDRGRYTCVATNVAASTNRTVHLIVNVPPQWTVQPTNTTAVLGRAVWIDCSAKGFPAPTILWKKLIYSTSSGSGDFTWVHSSPRAHRFNNGTLKLSDVEDSDAGAYLCQAQNGIGPGLSKIIHLKVRVPPQVVDPYHSVTTMEKSNVSLQCTVNGDPPIEVTWKKNDTAVGDSACHVFHSQQTNSDRSGFWPTSGLISDASSNTYRSRSLLDVAFKSAYASQRTKDETGGEILNQGYLTSQSVTSKGQTVSEIHIINAIRSEDTGMYTCLASSDIGSDIAQRQLLVQGKPEAPRGLVIDDLTSRSLTLKWQTTHDGNSKIKGSVVQYTSDIDKNWTNSKLIVSGPETKVTLRQLAPVTTYYLRVSVENSIGRSKPSESVEATTLEEAPSEAPRGIQVHSTGAQSMKVTWQPPPEHGRNGRIWGYYVGYRMSASSEPYHYEKVDVKEDAGQHSTYITGLKPFTLYDVVVKAFNSAGTGPKSQKVTEKTLETAPPTSPMLRVESTSSSTIEVSWDRDGRDKLAITEYTLHYKADGETGWHQQKLSGVAESFTLRGLRCGTRYSLYVTASNSLGTGEPSLPVNARTKGAAPMSPKIEGFLFVNRTSATLVLSKWRSMGCPIESFCIKYRLKHQNQWTYSTENVEPNIDKYSLDQLMPGKDYVAQITANSEAGATKAEYHFNTRVEPGVGSSFPAYGKQETEQPFYLNVTLVVPVVVSSLVLIIVIFSLTICLRKHSYDRRRERDCGSQKSFNDSLVMSDISKSVNASKGNSKTSHYSIPGKNADYAEPYAYKREDSDGLFATIKRCPTRPMCSSASYKQVGSEATSQTGGAGGQYHGSGGGGGTGGTPEPWNACAKSIG